MNNTMLKDYPDILTLEDVRKILKIGKTKSYELINEVGLNFRKIGKQYIISKQNVIEYIVTLFGVM